VTSRTSHRIDLSTNPRLHTITDHRAGIAVDRPRQGRFSAADDEVAEQQRARTVQRIEDDPRVAPYLAASYKLHLDEDRQDKLVALLMANSRPQPLADGATDLQPASLDTPEGIRAHTETERRLEPSLRALIGPAKTSELLTMVTFEQLQRRTATAPIHRERRID
jgi:hypothetical protein